MSPIDFAFIFAVIIFSLVIHELMHGMAADFLGDRTARYEGRLTLNPIKHMELFGSVIVPLLSSFTGFFFGWAKPVPYNPYNFVRFRYWGEAIVAFAGPLSNLVIAIVGGLFLRAGMLSPEIAALVFTIITVNCSLFLLNMLPLPPLDGSKILSSVLPYPLSQSYMQFRALFEQNFVLALVTILVLVNVFGSAFSAGVYALARTIAG
jgi:Zn-dependent protease